MQVLMLPRQEDGMPANHFAWELPAAAALGGTLAVSSGKAVSTVVYSLCCPGGAGCLGQGLCAISSAAAVSPSRQYGGIWPC